MEKMQAARFLGDVLVCLHIANLTPFSTKPTNNEIYFLVR